MLQKQFYFILNHKNMVRTPNKNITQSIQYRKYEYKTIMQ